MANAEERPEFLRWGHGEALSGGSISFSLP